MPETKVVPFGKYKGQPVEVMTADRDYCEWLIAQPWFRDKFSYIHNLIVVNPGEEQDTPEHNAMQALFLDKRMQIACIMQVYDVTKIDKYMRTYDIEVCTKYLSDIESAILSSSGDGTAWVKKRDCRGEYIEISKLSSEQDKAALELQKLYSSPFWSVDAYNIVVQFEHKGDDILLTVSGSYGPFNIGVELKPSIGDDYPSVIRQMKKRAEVDKRLLIYETSTWSLPDDKVRQVIELSGITVRTLEEIQSAAASIPDVLYLD